MFDMSHAPEGLSLAEGESRSPAFRQKTLRAPIGCSGVGLHSGKAINMTLKPAPIGFGVAFRRTDVTDRDSLVPAHFDTVVDTRLCTCVGNAAGVTVGTIEHLMSALAGSGIDNVLVEIDGPEVPVMDGSSHPFVFLIECAGVVAQEAPRRAIKILEPVSVSEGGASARLDPADDGFSVSFEIDFPVAAIGHQTFEIDFPVTDTPAGLYRGELAPARTFGLLEDVERLNRMGLALGGSLANAVVIGGGKVMNEEGLRFDDECVRHKALDAVGDLALAGAPIIGRFSGFKSGHAHTNLLLRALFARRDAWCWVELDDYAEIRDGSWQPMAALA